jgi:sorbitol-specific phosphotransferase system component IIC
MAKGGLKEINNAEIQIPLFKDRPIYGGDAVLYDPQADAPGYAVKPERKPAVRKTKTSSIMFVLFFVVVGCLFYTSTVIGVLRMGREMNELAMRYSTILSTNEVLRADINRKSNLERITQLAAEKAGMVNPGEAPAWFEIDHKRINALTSQGR